ncbi:MAG: two pore domain potassium channel family protein [Sphingomonas sp.]|nr:two pore domain potassium channel family protein [Sphingomonas sp.]
MIEELAVATFMVLLTAFIHALGLYALSRALRLEAMHAGDIPVQPLSPRGMILALFLVLGLFALHGIEIWCYAFLYWLVGALPDLHTSLYFSTITYGTVGYDDEGIASGWRLVAAIEGINGIVLLGWSIAFIVTVAARRHQH